MMTLKIKKKGLYIQIPGLPPFRTPADVNISHVSIPLVVSTLKAQGIEKFQIVSDTQGKEKVLTQKDFMVDKKEVKEDYETRFNKLESLMNKLLQTQVSNLPLNKEQITNRLSSIEKILRKKRIINIVKENSKRVKEEPKIEELNDVFIPNINLDGLEMKGESSQKTIKQDKLDIDDNADLLSRIIQSDE